MEKETVTLADQELASRIEKRNHFLKDIEQIINWKRINKVLSKVEIRRTSVAGRDAFSSEVMFRIMLIQVWYKLSVYQSQSPAKEFVLHDNADFMFGLKVILDGIGLELEALAVVKTSLDVMQKANSRFFLCPVHHHQICRKGRS